MKPPFKMLDVVKSIVDLVDIKDDMGDIVTLRKGDIGTIVMPLSENDFIIEFCEGLETIAIITLTKDQFELHWSAPE